MRRAIPSLAVVGLVLVLVSPGCGSGESPAEPAPEVSPPPPDASPPETTPADTTPPTVAVTSPAEGASLAGATVEVTGTAVDPAGANGAAASGVASVTVNGAAATLHADGTFAATVSGLSAGPLTLTAVALDAAGNVADASVHVTVQAPDTSAPVVAITTPVEGAAVPGPSVTVEGTVADPAGAAGEPGSGVASVTVNGVAATVQGGVFSAIITNVNPGPLAITATALDAAGNSASATVNVTVTTETDTTSPTVSITSPKAGDVVTGDTLVVTGAAADPPGPAGEVTSGLAKVTVNGTPATVQDGAFSVTLTGLAAGPLDVTATATDKAGNVATATVGVTVIANDATSPLVTISTPAVGAAITGGNVVVEGAVSDPPGPDGAAASGVADVTVNGTKASVSGGAFHVTVFGLEPGPLTLVATATDVAGNAASASVGIVVEPLLRGIATRAIALSFTTPGEKAPILVDALYDGALVTPVTSGVVFKSADPAVAGVGPDGMVTALADGQTSVTATWKGFSAAVSVQVRLDITPPREPRVHTYLEKTNLRVQSWTGDTEPHAVVEVTGGAAPAMDVADDDGRFNLTIPLTPQVKNPVQVTVTDTAGNKSEPYGYPITQDDALIDAGALHAHDATTLVGVAGAPLADPLVVRATDATGAALPFADVDLRVTVGDGRLAASAAGPYAGGSGVPSTVRVTADAEGYASAWWSLDEVPGPGNEVIATLPGDTGEPVLFRARGEPVGASLTTITGSVLDESLNGVAGASIQLVGTPVFTQADERGRFELGWSPVLPEPTEVTTVKLFVDGFGAATGKHARIEFAVTVIPGRRNEVLRPFFIPRIPGGVALSLDAEGRTTESIVIERTFGPGEAPTRVHVPAGTKVTWPKDLAVANQELALIDIATNRTPMPLPDGLYSRHVIAVQPGGTKFEPPLPLDLPNVDGLPPGAQVEVMSFDHDQARYLAVGTATVTPDGERVITDAGSGVKVGAWHASPPQRAPDECTVQGSLVGPNGKKLFCKCILPDGKVFECEPGKPFSAYNIPCDGTQSKVEVKCDEEDKKIVIVQPAKKEVVQPRGKPWTAVAASIPSGCEGDIEWTVEGPAVPNKGKGPTITTKWPEKGTYAVTASSKNKKCEGSDQVAVKVMDCVEAGAVRVCGQDIEEVKEGEFKVSGSVTIGRGGEQFLRVSGAVTAKTGAEASAEGNGSWTMDTGLFFKRLPNYELFAGPWSISGTGAITFGKDTGAPGEIKVALVGIPIVSSKDAVLKENGVGFDAPKFKLKFGDKVSLQFDSLEVLTTTILPGGSFEVTEDIPLFNIATLKKVSAGYNVKTDVVTGAFGIEFGKGFKKVELDLDIEIEKGTLKKVHGKAEFKRSIGNVEATGIPIPTSPTSPIYLLSIDAGVENPTFFLYPLTTDPGVKIYGGFELGLGPRIVVGKKKVSVGVLHVEGSFKWHPALVVEVKGTVDALNYEGELTATGSTQAKGGKTTLASGSVSASLDMTSSVKLSATEGLSLGPKEGFGPFSGPVATVDQAGSVEFFTSPYNIVGAFSMTGTLKVPDIDCGLFTIPSFDLASAKGSVDFNYNKSYLKLFLGTENWLPFLGHSTVFAAFETGEGFTFNICNEDGCLFSPVLSEGPFLQDPMPVDIPAGLPSVEIKVTHDGPFTCDLRKPDGSVLAWDAPPPPANAPAKAFFLRELVPGESTWVVTKPEPGVYELTDCTPVIAAKEVFVETPDVRPTIALVEPFAATGAVVHVGWVATNDGDATVSLATETEPGGDAKPFATVDLSEGVSSVDLDTSKMAPGAYFIRATIADGVTPPVTVHGLSPIVVDGGGDPALPPAPRLVRGASSAEGIRVSWLPGGAGPDASYSVVAEPDGPGPVLRADTTRTAAVLTGATAGTRYRLQVSAADADGTTGPASSAVYFTSDGTPSLRIVSHPRTVVRTGKSWAYTPVTSGGGQAGALLLALGPAGMAVAGSALTYSPAPGDEGVHDVTLTVPDKDGGDAAAQTFQLTVVADDTASGDELLSGANRVRPPPEILSAPSTADAVVGVPWTYDVVSASVDDDVPVVTLVSGPAAMTLGPKGHLAWTPTAAEAVAAHGVVAVTVRATSASGQSVTQTALLRFADADGDGLPTDYERASGLDPYAKDDPAADPDKDGLTHAAEAAAGTRGDAPDSDGDGLGDAAEVQAGTDPRLGDTDLDGLSDADEKAKGTSALEVDTDKDGVSDGDEVAQGTDPKGGAADSDGDGLADDLEQAKGLDPSQSDADGDGCDDSQEQAAGTSVFKADTDSDGANDCDELAAGTDPVVASGDSDGDQLSDDREATLGTDPQGRDSDGDGFEDGVELGLGTDPKAKGSKPGVAPGQPNAPAALRGASPSKPFLAFEVIDVGPIELVRDDDVDGAPNDFELAYGYDPNDAKDGSSDDDADGLTLFAEAKAGTDPKKMDTDGDGVSDGQEVQDGTDPLDKGSFSVAGPVVALKVLPAKASLTSNTFFGPASMQLVVLGLRGDGTTTDLTAAKTGTAYAIDPPGSATIGPDGLLVATPSAGAGTLVVTVQNNKLKATVPVTTDVFTPQGVASLELGGLPGPLDVDGARLLVAVEGSVCLVDVSDPEHPALGGKVQLFKGKLDQVVEGVALSGSLGLAALGKGGLAVLDVSGAAPVRTAQIPLSGSAHAVALGLGRAYVATSKGLAVIDLGVPGGLSLLDLDGDGADDRVLAVVQPGVAFTAVDRSFGQVVAGTETSQVFAYQEGPSGLLPGKAATVFAPPKDVLSAGSRVYAALGPYGVAEIDVVATPATVSAMAGTVPGAFLSPYANALFVGIQGLPAAVTVIGTKAPGQLPVLGSIAYPGNSVPSALGLDLQGRYHYVSAAPSELFVGQHDALTDLMGMAPTLLPVRPAAKAELEEGTLVAFEVLAVDDVAVAEVVLRMDGKPVATLAAPPWLALLPLPNVSKKTPVVLSATAKDLGGNVAELEPYDVINIPVVDTVPPKVAFLTPAKDSVAGGLQSVTATLAILDEHAIAKVELRRDGELVATLTTPPWTAAIPIPAQAVSEDRKVVLTASVTDIGDNVGQAKVVLNHGGVDLVALGATSIGALDTTYDGVDILVRSGIASIEGAHTFKQVTVGAGGILTHGGTIPGKDEPLLDLTADAIHVAAGGAIDASGQGYLGDCAPGDDYCGAGGHTLGNSGFGAPSLSGGSHAGQGGGAQTTPLYGDFRKPASIGSGGGYGSGGADYGGNGGGRMHVTCGLLDLQGDVRADGLAGQKVSGTRGAGGAGGSVWLEVGTLSGAGSISASGGPGGGPTAGGPASGAGGGGRVSLTVKDASAFDLGHVQARGGDGDLPGAPGSVYIAMTGGADSLVIDDGGTSGGLEVPAITPKPTGSALKLGALVVRGTTRLVVHDDLEVESLAVEDEAVMTHTQTTPGAEAGLTITATTVTIAKDAALDATGRGYLGDCAPFDDYCGAGGHTLGNNGFGTGQQSGGSHAGVGGGATPVATYGAPSQPADLGSGGGYGTSGAAPGGNGGGRLHIVADVLTVDGDLLAEGAAGSSAAPSDGGGGGGGALWLEVGTLGGAGRIGANGGASGPAGGSGGGGGRVALEYTTLDPKAPFDLAKLSARGGAGPLGNGGPGTVLVQKLGAAAELRIENGGLTHTGETAPWPEIGRGRVTTVQANAITNDKAKWRPGALKGLRVGFDGTEATFLVIGNTASTLTLDPKDGLVASVAGPGTSYHGLRAQPGTVSIGGAARVPLMDHLSTDHLTVSGKSLLTHAPTLPGRESGLTLNVTVDMGVSADSAVDVSGRGYLGDCQPLDSYCGAGGHTLGDSDFGSGQHSGGSHGGIGGGGTATAVYDDLRDPGDLGSGGGYGQSGAEAGGSGGGRVHITTPKLILDGPLLADGAASPPVGAKDGAGGAGGAIRLDVGTFLGKGAISASGGSGGKGGTSGAGGGGGRIALYLTSAVGFDASAVKAVAGGGSGPGGSAGTVYYEIAGAAPVLVIDDGGATGGSDSAALGPDAAGQPFVLDGSLLVRGHTRLLAEGPLHVTTLALEGDTRLVHRVTSASVEGDLEIEATTLSIGAKAAIDVSGRGYLGDCAPGDDYCGAGGHTIGNVNSFAGAHTGGSHGGPGGRASPPGIGPTFGDPLRPRTLGGGGSYGTSGAEAGGSGGGRIHIVADVVLLDGQLRADGSAPLKVGASDGGAGAGGSILVEAGVLGGKGLISANGGGPATGSLLGVGGGGGRVALLYDALDAISPFDLTHVTAVGGAGPEATGGGGTFVIQVKGGKVDLRITNGGLATLSEAAPWTEVGVAKVASVAATEVTLEGAAWRPDSLVGARVGFEGTSATFRIVGNTATALTTNPADGSLLAVAAPGTWAHGVHVIDGDVLVTGGTRLRLADRLEANSITVTGGASITHPPSDYLVEHGLTLVAKAGLTIGDGSVIDVLGRGYVGDCAPGDDYCGAGGHTLGNVNGGAGLSSGGSHGGLGGGLAAKAVYGSAAAPLELGGGGGYGDPNLAPGGNGGGRVHLVASTLVLDGTIIADGSAGSLLGGVSGGGGAGGSVWLQSGVLSGHGLATAAGGNGSGGGGGGRNSRAGASATGFTGTRKAPGG